MDKWKYSERYYNPSVIKIPFLKWLNDYGQDGWELVYVEKDGYNYYNCIFKRKIDEL